MVKVIVKSMVKVILIDKDRVTEHARGEIDPAKIYRSSTLLERNKRLYELGVWRDGAAYYFEMANQPYIITEF